MTHEERAREWLYGNLTDKCDPTSPPIVSLAAEFAAVEREALTVAATICGDHICEWDACGCGDLCREIESLRDGKDQPSEPSGGSQKGS